jgi:hypothetical protein
MERMGPEALMVQSRVLPRVDLAEYARLEYTYEDIRVVAAGLRALPAVELAPPSGIGRWILRAQAWLHGRAPGGAAERLEPAEPCELAALPTLATGAVPLGEPTPVWGIPALARVRER